MDLGLLIIRVVVGLLLAGHGTQKLFGWWGGHGLNAAGGFFHSLGHRPGKLMAAIAGLSEAGGGALLALGLLTPLAAAIVLGVMIVAGSVHAPKGLWATNGGYELPLAYAVVAAGFGFTGAGRFSLDHALGLDALHGGSWGLAALLVGVVAAAATLARRSMVLRRASAGQSAGQSTGQAAYPDEVGAVAQPEDARR